ncbi:MAG TPA: hypothetical protein VN408_08555 [Actinoplanes sp.]|nr:hypothetical protein [Actinoplanes sp.]
MSCSTAVAGCSPFPLLPGRHRLLPDATVSGVAYRTSPAMSVSLMQAPIGITAC